jgi:hypothetical protein
MISFHSASHSLKRQIWRENPLSDRQRGLLRDLGDSMSATACRPRLGYWTAMPRVSSWQRAGVALTVASAVALAPALAPPHDGTWSRVVLAAESAATAAVSAPSAYDAVRPWLEYGAQLSLWAGRFLPVPGAILFHASVAESTIVDPWTARVVSNLNAFVQGQIPLVGAEANIGRDLVGDVGQFVQGELTGHEDVVPPVSTPVDAVGPWVQWLITTAIAPLYYLPVPNALTVDQLSFAGRLAGTLISSVIANLGNVAGGAVSVEQALSNVLATWSGQALPAFLQSEQLTFIPPAPPGNVLQSLNALAIALAAQEKDWSQVHGPVDLLSQLGIHALGVVLQEFSDPVPILRQVVDDQLGDLRSLAAGTAPSAILAAKLTRASRALAAVAEGAQMIGGALSTLPHAVGMQLAKSAQTLQHALAAGDPAGVISAAAQGLADVATSALNSLHDAGADVESLRNDVAAALGDKPSAPTAPTSAHESSTPEVSARVTRDPNGIAKTPTSDRHPAAAAPGQKVVHDGAKAPFHQPQHWRRSSSTTTGAAGAPSGHPGGSGAGRGGPNAKRPARVDNRHHGSAA